MTGCIFTSSSLAQAQDKASVSAEICREFNHAAKEGNKHYKLRMNGYSTEIPIAQAVEDFNQLAKCHRLGKTQPPLTVEEILAAIRDTHPSEKKLRSWVYNTYQDIGKTEKLPKGTFIDFGMGSETLGGYIIEKWSIILYVGLNKYTRELKGNPFFELYIRNQYISSQHSKSKPLDPPEKYDD